MKVMFLLVEIKFLSQKYRKLIKIYIHIIQKEKKKFVFFIVSLHTNKKNIYI